MAKAKALSYEEFMEYAKAHYYKGGDGYVECWEKYQFDEYVKMFGPITKRAALKMFRLDYEIEKEQIAFMKMQW